MCIYSMNKIEHYMDYRKFLRDFYNEKKKSAPYFSYRYFCNKANIKSPSFFKEVIDGKRNLTAKNITAFIKVLGLDEEEANYFATLVRFNQSKSSHEKKELFVKMYSSVKKTLEYPVPMAYYEYYKNWYNIAVKKLVCILDWKNDYNLLARSVIPPITKQQAKNSVTMLLKFGFIIKSNDGTYKQRNTFTKPSEEVKALGRKELLHQFAALGDEAIDRFTKEEKDITFMTFHVSQKRYSLIKNEIAEFYDRLRTLMDYMDYKDSDARKDLDQVYQVNIQAFPLSKRVTHPLEIST